MVEADGVAKDLVGFGIPVEAVKADQDQTAGSDGFVDQDGVAIGLV